MTKPTFPSYAERCGWNALLPARRPKPSAAGDITAKYAIVGAGFTGLATARRLAELDPAADIVVLEATTVGEGSSGRNSGFIAGADITGSIDASAVEKSIARNRYVTEGFNWLLDLISRHAIACDLHQTGRIKAAATRAGEVAVDDLLTIVRALNVPHVLLDAGELRQRIGTAYYRRGLFTETGHMVQPAAFIRGLADALPPSVHLFEQSPVHTLSKRGKWRLETADARITADTVIMATNAAIKNFGYLRDRVVTIYTYAAITQPIAPAASIGLGSMPSWGLLPAHRLGTTLRRVGRDRLLVRSLYSYERGVSSQYARTELLARFHRRFPDLAHVGIEHAWGGTTALTMNGAPFWGQIDDRLYASGGCNGSGIVKGTVLGRRLAEHIAGHDVEAALRAAYGTANWIAPEPFRTLGYKVVSLVEQRKAGLES
jgi:glycine/D-amino acid oxidase-like deaminating enzyme